MNRTCFDMRFLLTPLAGLQARRKCSSGARQQRLIQLQAAFVPTRYWNHDDSFCGNTEQELTLYDLLNRTHILHQKCTWPKTTGLRCAYLTLALANHRKATTRCRPGLRP